MNKTNIETTAKYFLAARDFHHLFDKLRKMGYLIIGPKVVEDDLTYSPLDAVADLPIGWTDRQEGGVFRLEPRDDGALFGYGVGQHSWKKFLFPPVHRLWQAERGEDGWRLVQEPAYSPPMAFLGVRACDLAALEVLDRVFLKGDLVDATYRARREPALVVAVHCTQAGGACFCASMGTGPKAASGYDIALTEVPGGEHYFVAEAGTARGADILAAMPVRPAAAPEIEAAAALAERAVAAMGRRLETDGLKELLYRNLEHPRWAEVAGRCLTCGNCTMVCPTCFCHTVEDTLDLAGAHTERWRRMQVCFTLDFSYIHGGSVRSSSLSRYRQWLTHKLATWVDQFGCFGCVGCGRCITWCPVAIDITEEAGAIRERDGEKISKGEQQG
jgi:sulfhydrogenase subunit beta (sulfur reductase)